MEESDGAAYEKPRQSELWFSGYVARRGFLARRNASNRNCRKADMTAGKDSQLAWTPVPVKEKGHECENRGIGWCVLEFGFYFVSYEKLSELSDIFRAVF